MAGQKKRGSRKSSGGSRAAKAQREALPVSAPSPSVADDASMTGSISFSHLVNGVACVNGLSQATSDHGLAELVVKGDGGGNCRVNGVRGEIEDGQAQETKVAGEIETKSDLLGELVAARAELGEKDKKLEELASGRDQMAQWQRLLEEKVKQMKSAQREWMAKQEIMEERTMKMHEKKLTEVEKKLAESEKRLAQSQGKEIQSANVAEKREEEWKSKLFAIEKQIGELVRARDTREEKLREAQYREQMTRMCMDDEKKRMTVKAKKEEEEAAALRKKVEEKAVRIERLEEDLAKAREKAVVLQKENEALRAKKRELEAWSKVEVRLMKPRGIISVLPSVASPPMQALERLLEAWVKRPTSRWSRWALSVVRHVQGRCRTWGGNKSGKGIV